MQDNSNWKVPILNDHSMVFPITFMDEEKNDTESAIQATIEGTQKLCTEIARKTDLNSINGNKILETGLKVISESISREQNYYYNRNIAAINAENALALENQKTRNRIFVAEYSAQLKARQLEGIELRKENKKNSWDKLSMDEYGVLEVVTMSPNNIPESKPRKLLDITHLRMTQIYPKNYYSERVAVITWDDMDESIVLSGSSYSPTGLGKVFNKYGVRIHSATNYKKDKLELIWNYLVRNSNRLDKVAFLGWNLTKDGWKFQKEYEDTFEILLGGDVNEG